MLLKQRFISLCIVAAMRSASILNLYMQSRIYAMSAYSVFTWNKRYNIENDKTNPQIFSFGLLW